MRPGWTGVARAVDVHMQGLQQGLASGGTNLSIADLIQLCGALAVELTGGPSIPVQLGRQDASQPDTDNQLPTPDMQPTQLQQLFSSLALHKPMTLSLLS